MEKMIKGAEIFLNISVHLTGFNEMDLLGTGMLETYYHAFEKNNDPGTAQSFLAEAEKILKENKGDEQGIADGIVNNLIASASFGALTKNIITLWYTGDWAGVTVSGQAYVQGLIWNVAESHPPGAKQPGFDSWSREPIKITPHKIA